MSGFGRRVAGGRLVWLSLAVAAMPLALGCSSQGDATSDTEGTPARNYVLAEEPAGARPVAEVRKAAQQDEEVAVIGRIGGTVDPFVSGMAAFLIVDPALKPCVEGCGAPWDYCCELDALPASKAMVRLVDSNGSTISGDARKLLGVKELTTVVVHGKAKRDEAGNLTVLADGVYLK